MLRQYTEKNRPALYTVHIHSLTTLLGTLFHVHIQTGCYVAVKHHLVFFQSSIDQFNEHVPTAASEASKDICCCSVLCILRCIPTTGVKKG